MLPQICFATQLFCQLGNIYEQETIDIFFSRGMDQHNVPYNRSDVLPAPEDFKRLLAQYTRAVFARHPAQPVQGHYGWP